MRSTIRCSSKILFLRVVHVGSLAHFPDGAAAFAAKAEALKLGKLLPVMNAYDYSGNDIAKTGYMGAFCKANKS